MSIHVGGLFFISLSWLYSISPFYLFYLKLYIFFSFVLISAIIILTIFMISLMIQVPPFESGSLIIRWDQDILHRYPIFVVSVLSFRPFLPEGSDQASSKSTTNTMYAPSSYNDTVVGETLSSISEKSRESYTQEDSVVDYEVSRAARNCYMWGRNTPGGG